MTLKAEVVLYPGFKQFQLFTLQTAVFKSYRDWGTKLTLPHQITRNTAVSKVPDMCCLCSQNSKNLFSFALQPGVYVLQTILGQVHCRDPQVILNIAKLNFPQMCVASVHEPNF